MLGPRATVLSPDEYDTVRPYDLLVEVERGRIGFDHRVIGSLDRRRAEAVADLARFTEEIEPEREKRRARGLEEECLHLWRYFRVKEAAPYYVRLLAACGGEAPDELVEALAELGEPALDPLLAHLDTLEPDEAGDTLFALAELGVRDERALRRLLDGLAHDPFEGALALGAYGDPAALPHIETALAHLAPEQADERRVLLEARDTISSGVVRRDFPPFDIYELYPAEEDPLFDALDADELAGYLRSNVARWRAGAARALAELDYPETLLDVLLEQATQDASPAARGAAVQALAGWDDPRAEDVLRQALDGESAEVRAGAVIALASESDDPRVHRRIMELYRQPEWRAAALEAMGRSGDLVYSEDIVRSLQDPDPRVRREALTAVGLLDLSEQAEAVAAMFEDEDVRKDALLAYAAVRPARITRKGVHELFDEIGRLAGGLTEMETELVAEVLDARLRRHGLRPVFRPSEDEVRTLHSEKVGRNDPCPCGSGKKYKKCCGA